MSPRPPRNAEQTNLQESIKETAWSQIAEFGAPALSLRAIARQLHIAAPAIYNYFPRRDDLVTALIIDAYADFGDSQLSARDSIPVETSGTSGRIRGTAWVCMFEPMSARLASSCSRKGISEALTPTICRGATSMKSTCSGPAKKKSP